MRRGLLRMGVALSFMWLAVAAPTLVWVIQDSRAAEASRARAAQCALDRNQSLPPGAQIDVGGPLCDGFLYGRFTVQQLRSIASGDPAAALKSYSLAALFLAASALAIVGAFWGIGWVAAGFMRD